MSLDITGLDSLKIKMAAMQSRLKNPEPGLKRAGMVVLKAAKEHIKSGGPGWAPNLTGTPLLFASGRLINSLTLGDSDNQAEMQGINTLVVGTNLPYAKYLQFGTGIYGPKGQPITASNGKALSFMIGGTRVVVKSVKGSPKRPFLYVDDAVASSVKSVYQRYIMGSEEVGA